MWAITENEKKIQQVSEDMHNRWIEFNGSRIFSFSCTFSSVINSFVFLCFGFFLCVTFPVERTLPVSSHNNTITLQIHRTLYKLRWSIYRMEIFEEASIYYTTELNAKKWTEAHRLPGFLHRCGESEPALNHLQRSYFISSPVILYLFSSVFFSLLLECEEIRNKVERPSWRHIYS